MLYSNLFKGISCALLMTLLTSCGGLNTEEVVIDDCIKIPSQKIKLSVNDYSDEEETDIDLECSIAVEKLKDCDGTLRMYLYDENDIELIKLIGEELPEVG